MLPDGLDFPCLNARVPADDWYREMQGRSRNNPIRQFWYSIPCHSRQGLHNIEVKRYDLKDTGRGLHFGENASQHFGRYSLLFSQVNQFYKGDCGNAN